MIYIRLSQYFCLFLTQNSPQYIREGLLLYIVHTLAQYCGKTSQFLHKIPILYCLITFPIGAEKAGDLTPIHLLCGGKKCYNKHNLLSRNPKPYGTTRQKQQLESRKKKIGHSELTLRHDTEYYQ